MSRFLRRALGVESTRSHGPETAAVPLTPATFAARPGTVREDEALTLTAVYRAVSLLSETMASLPVDVYERRGATRHAAPRPAWLDRPNDEDLWLDLVSQTMTSLALRGNAFLWVEREGGKVSGIYVLDPDRVTAERKPTSSGRASVHFAVDGTPVSSRSMLHIAGLRKPGDLLGLSPIAAASETIAVALAAQRHTRSLLENQANPAGLIEVPGTLSAAGATQLSKQWNAYHGGSRRGGVAVLTEGAKFNRLTLSSVDAEVLSTRKWQVVDVARAFGVPPTLLSEMEASSSWGAGVIETNRAFAVYGLTPWTTRLEAHFSRLLQEDNPRAFLRFNLDALLRPDTEARFKSYKIGLEAGFLTTDEVRAYEDLAPLPRNDSGAVIA